VLTLHTHKHTHTQSRAGHGWWRGRPPWRACAGQYSTGLGCNQGYRFSLPGAALVAGDDVEGLHGALALVGSPQVLDPSHRDFRVSGRVEECLVVQGSKETSCKSKRNQIQEQKKANAETKETQCDSERDKRNLMYRQKRPNIDSKETYYQGIPGAARRISNRQQRPNIEPKETYCQGIPGRRACRGVIW
jgi:hypothetical protein